MNDNQVKVIILAAGRGTRLNKYTDQLPKGMLNVLGKPIIQRQIEVYRSAGIEDISIVRGYMADKINFAGVTYYCNEQFATTNMIESLFCASDTLQDDVIISYADILFEPRVLNKVITCKDDVSVLVDEDWQDFWQARYGKVDFDTESLKFGSDGRIVDIGKDSPKLEEIDARYVGMIRLSPKGSQLFKDTYYQARELHSGKTWLNGRKFENIFMTDFLQELIDQGNKVTPTIVQRGWYEFDTNEDYEKFNSLQEKGELVNFIKI